MLMEQLVQQTLQRVFKDNNLIFDRTCFAGGLTNYNYIMNIQGVDYVIRQPGGMTEEIIDRKIERLNNNIASEFGVNSDCIYFDETSGIKISVYINNSLNMAQSGPDSPENLAAVTKLMKKIHCLPRDFSNRFDWQTELAKYERIIEKQRGDLFYDYATLKGQLVNFVQQNIKNTTLVPCHNDTVPENFIIDNTGRTYLIDWEYSGMNDPCWDVAAYIIESKLSNEAIEHLVQYYFSQPLTPEMELRIKCYMMAQDLLWTVWALIRHYHGDDFLDYCNFRYERFRKNIKAINRNANYPLDAMVKC